MGSKGAGVITAYHHTSKGIRYLFRNSAALDIPLALALRLRYTQIGSGNCCICAILELEAEDGKAWQSLEKEGGRPVSSSLPLCICSH